MLAYVEKMFIMQLIVLGCLMTEAHSEKYGVIGRFIHRKERRIASANELASSQPVKVLKDILSQRYPDAVLTVTEPDGHPFAKIYIEATWNINREWRGVITEREGQARVEVWTGRQIKVFWADFEKEKHVGYLINSREEEDRFIPRDASRNAIIAAIKEATEKPLAFQGPNKPGLERGRRIIK